MREIRVSPDGDSVAIRSDYPADGPLAWGVFNAINGGHWSPDSAVEEWVPLPVPEPAPAAEPAPAS